MSEKSRQAVGFGSQLVFHSIRGQLCVTSLLPHHQLLAQVRRELTNLPSGLTQGQVVNRLFARVSGPRDSAWTPRMSRLSMNREGVRVFVHSDTDYIVNPTLSGQFHEPELLKRAEPQPRRWATAPDPPQPRSSLIHVVLQNMEGNIVVSLNAPKDSVRHVIRDILAQSHSRAESNAAWGAIVSALWETPDVVGTMSLDIGFSENTSDTLWLRHISGENYVLFEGPESQPLSWEIIGRGFVGPHMDKHFRVSDLNQRVSPVEELAS